MTSPLRTLRQIVAPNGKHRRPPARIPVRYVPLDETELEQLLDTGEAVANESAPCSCCGRHTFHAMHRDGSRCCWTCNTVTPAGAL